MDILVNISTLGVYVVMAVSVITALAVVTLRNLFHSALCLVAVLLGVSIIYLSLHAEFLAMVQILIYVGAVMTLVIFAIMLTGNFSDQTVRQTNKQGLVALGVALPFLFFLFQLIQRTPWPVRQEAVLLKVSTFDLAQALLGPYVFPFEVISVVLIAALIGAIVIAKREKSR